MPDAAEFDTLSAEFYAGWFHFHPDLALRIGFPVAGRLLPASDADELVALRGWLEELLLGLDEIDFTALDADRQLDWELMVGAARVEYRELLVERDRHGLDPLRLLPLAEVDWLVRERAGEPEALVRLLREIPDHLRQAQTQLRTVAPGLALPLIRTAADQAQEGCAQLRELGRGPLPRHGHPDLGGLLEAAAAALAGYGQYLTEKLAPRARGVLGCGVEHLGRRLREVHFIDCAPAADEGPVDRVLREAELALTEPPTVADPPGASREGGNTAVAADPVHPTRLPRRLANPASLTVGWRLYQGLRTTGEAGQCLLRARIDLDLHRGRCNGEQALDTLRRHGITGPPADALLAQIARHPGDALAGVLGWRLLDQAHELLKAGGGPTEAKFHDRLFSLGAIPLPLVLRYGFGQSLWQGAHALVCGG